MTTAAKWLPGRILASGIPEVHPRNALDALRNEDGDWKQGERPEIVIETWDDLRWLLRYSIARRPRAICGYCGSTRQLRNEREGERWFYGHACSEGVWPDEESHVPDPHENRVAA